MELGMRVEVEVGVEVGMEVEVGKGGGVSIPLMRCALLVVVT